MDIQKAKTDCCVIPTSNNRKNHHRSWVAVYHHLLFLYDLMYRNANKKQIAPSVGKQLLSPLSYLDGDCKIWGISQSLWQAVVSWTGWCWLAVLLWYRAAAPGTSWLSASRGASVVVLLGTDWQTMKYCPCRGKLLLIRSRGEHLTLLSLLLYCAW